MHLPRRRSQSGFTLLEVLLAIGISLTIGAVALTEMRRDNESSQAKAVGQQLAMVGNALNNYLALQHTRIINLEDRPVGSPLPDDPGPRYCTANVTTLDGHPVSICTITTNTLVSGGMLPRNFSGRNAFGAGYDLYIRVIGDPALAVPVIDGMVVVNQPYTTGGAAPRYELMGQAIQEAGADAGMTRTTANLMEGLNGTWRDEYWPAVIHDGVNYPGVNQLGLLGYRVGYGSSAFAAFLRLDGTLSMTGNLNMDRNDITMVEGLDAGHIYAKDAISLGARGDMDASYPDRTDFVPGVGTDGGTMAIRNAGGVRIEDMGGSGGKLYAGEIQGSGNMEVNGDIRVTGNITAQDLIGRSAQMSGFMHADGNITSDANIGADGNIIAGGTVGGNLGDFNRIEVGEDTNQYTLTSQGLGRAGGPSWFYDNSASAWRTVGAGIVSDGEFRGESLRADNQVIAGGVVRVDGTYGSSTVGVGTSCASNAMGAMRRGSTGELVQCVNGKWSVMGIRTTVATATISQTSVGGQGAATATCPADTTLIGGGYALQNPANQPAPGGMDSNSPSSSYPNGNGWTVQMGRDTGVGASFQIRALCAY